MHAEEPVGLDTTPRRRRVIGEIADSLCVQQLGHPVRVAVDGVTAAGKTTLANEVAEAVAVRGRPAIRLSMDGFHQPRARRHRHGRLSAVGYYQDAYDFAGLRQLVLVPLGPGGSGRYCAAILDLTSDRALQRTTSAAPLDAVLIVDGTFLQLPEIVEHWDLRIYVDTSFEAARRRGLARDGVALGRPAQARLLYERRYHAACRMYIDDVRPAERASIVVNNNDVGAPRIVVSRIMPVR